MLRRALRARDRAILYNAPGEREHQHGQHNVRPRSVESIIGFSEAEHPIVLQLGGAEPEPMYRASRIGAARGFDELNLNCGCPAQVKGRSKNIYGARLMKDPEKVAACCAAMVRAVDDAAAAGELPPGRPKPRVTVKCRLGCDQVDSWEELLQYSHGCHASSQLVQFKDGTIGVLFDDGGPFPAGYNAMKGDCKDKIQQIVGMNETMVQIKLESS